MTGAGTVHSNIIAVAGESLMDMLPDEQGRLIPVPGGAPFNVARIVAQLGAGCTFLTRLSEDELGRRLREELRDAGVLLAIDDPVASPTTLAMAELDAAGSADYRFYGEGTAAAELRSQDIPSGFLDGVRALSFGGLGLVLEPLRSTLLGLLAEMQCGPLVVLDPNCRPRAVGDAAGYRATVASCLPSVDVLKVSRDDLEFLAPAEEPIAYCERLLNQGPGVILITDGPRPTTLITAEGSRSIPVREVELVDTIGAGDALVAGLLAWFAEHPEVDPKSAGLDALEIAVQAAARVARAVCTMRGANLPHDFSWPKETSNLMHSLLPSPPAAILVRGEPPTTPSPSL
jgi:fructokinase